jgi:excinuclease UvrABC ATPase subunit
MKIKHYCRECDGTGIKTTSDAYSPLVSITCPTCVGVGYLTQDILSPELDALIETVDDIKTKLNHVKNKVDDIWDKVK